MRNDPLPDLYRVKRGLAGYVSYLAACEMNESFSEYILYEPTLRILTAQGWSVQCEYPCPGYPKKAAGDLKKIDFVATKHDGSSIAIEMKWVRTKTVNLLQDIEKLTRYRESNSNCREFIILFGRCSHLLTIQNLAPQLIERGGAVVADFGVTRYACRSYELKVT